MPNITRAEKLLKLSGQLLNGTISPAEYIAESKKLKRAAQAAKSRAEREQLMRDCGLTKVRGNLGGTYWE